MGKSFQLWNLSKQKEEKKGSYFGMLNVVLDYIEDRTWNLALCKLGFCFENFKFEDSMISFYTKRCWLGILTWEICYLYIQFWLVLLFENSWILPVALQKRKNEWIISEVFSTKKLDLCCNFRLVIEELASGTRVKILSTFTIFTQFVKFINHTNLSCFLTYKGKFLSVSLCKYFDMHRLSVGWDDGLRILSLLYRDRSGGYLKGFVEWQFILSYVVKGKCIFETAICFKQLLQCHQRN